MLGPWWRPSMNRLVDALRLRRQLIDRAVPQGRMSYSLLADELGSAMLSDAERAVIEDHPEFLRRLSRGYLPIITAGQWNSALQNARPASGVGAGWWTVMVAATSGQAGVTVPQDSSRTNLVALFRDAQLGFRTEAYDPALETFLDTSADGHCSALVRGRCAPGECGGCSSERVWDKATGEGIKCICSHSMERR